MDLDLPCGNSKLSDNPTTSGTPTTRTTTQRADKGKQVLPPVEEIADLIEEFQDEEAKVCPRMNGARVTMVLGLFAGVVAVGALTLLAVGVGGKVTYGFAVFGALLMGMIIGPIVAIFLVVLFHHK